MTPQSSPESSDELAAELAYKKRCEAEGDFEISYEKDMSIDLFLAGCAHARAEMEADIFSLRLAIDEAHRRLKAHEAERDALKQEVAGGSWAFVKQIEHLKAELAAKDAEIKRMREALEDARGVKDLPAPSSSKVGMILLIIDEALGLEPKNGG